MKKIYLSLIAVLSLSTINLYATQHNITISGVAYVDNDIDAFVGDTVTIEATGNHPLVQVEQSVWDLNGNTPLGSGWGTEITTFTFKITTSDDIYYVCSNHVGAGMKGKINVSVPTGTEDLANAQTLDIFPNPVVGNSFSIKGNQDLFEESQLNLYNVQGQLVKSIKVLGERINLEGQLNAGVYTGVLVKNDKVILRKRLVFIKE